MLAFNGRLMIAARKRHHIRFWGLPLDRAEETLDTPAFWRKAPRPSEGESGLWVGAATRDTGISLTRLTFQITHATDADTNEERNFIISELQSHGVIENVHFHAAGERVAVSHVNRYITDGEMSIADLVAIA